MKRIVRTRAWIQGCLALLVSISNHARAQFPITPTIFSDVSAGNASIPEPAAVNIAYYLDPAGNLVSLEYDVPFRAGFSAILETKREQAVVRFPADTPFRFIAHMLPGKVPDIMQVDPDKGWRTIPIDWAGKDKGKVGKGGKAARLVAFDSTAVGTGSVLMTPKDPLAPGEYCINLHSEAWYCFGVDAGGAPGAQTEATAGAGLPAQAQLMTNADVIKMVSAGLSPEIVANTVRQSTNHAFDLSIDSLIALKKGNVPDVVVAAMQQASTAGPGAGPSAASAGPSAVPDSKIPVPTDLSAFFAIDARARLVKLEVGKADLVDARHTLTEGNQIYYKLFGAKSPVRFTDGMVPIVIKLPPKPHGLAGFLDPDAQFGDLYQMQIRRWEPVEGTRQARFDAREQRRGRDQDPDPGTFEYATMKLGEGFYKIIPIEPLIPGEYCMGLHRLPTEVERLYCFGIDPAR